MTTTEYIGAAILISLFSTLLTMIFTGKNKVSVTEFENHKKDNNPHSACPVHTVQLENIEKVVARIDRRVYHLVGGQHVEGDEE